MSDPHVVMLILACAIVTYATRAGGHLLLSRFDRLHPRIEAALEAVPAAVMTTLIAPPAFSNGPAEMLAIGATIAASFRLGVIATLAIGMAVLIAARAAGL
jgi:uncharacterized membrane protein